MYVCIVVDWWGGLSGLTLLTSRPVLPCTLRYHPNARMYVCCILLAYCMCEYTTFVCFCTLFAFPTTVMHTRPISTMCILFTTWIGVGTFDRMTVVPVYLCISSCDHLLFLGKQQCSQLNFVAWLTATITFATVACSDDLAVVYMQ